MNIFGVGTAEFVLILLIMLIVAGPKRMVRWAYTVGLWLGKLRGLWSQVVDAMEKEMREAGYDVDLPRDLPTRQNITQIATKALKPYTDEFQKEAQTVTAPLKATTTAADKLIKDGLKNKPESAPAPIVPKVEPLGTWSQSVENATPHNTADAAHQFGAWSQPEHPSQNNQGKINS